jgi:hypothetical protein
MSRPKSQTRRIIEQLDLIEELHNSTLRQIALKYNTQTTMISEILTNQLRTNFKIKQLSALDTDPEKGFEEELLRSKGVGEWTHSSERKSIIEYKKKIINKKPY